MSFRGSCLRLLLSLGALWLAAAEAAAQEAPVRIVVAGPAIAGGGFSVGVDDFAGEVRLRNAGATAQRLLPSGRLVRAWDAASAPVEWKRRDAAADPLLLAACADAVFDLVATLPGPGRYETFLEAATIGTAASSAERLRIEVERTAEPLPAEFLAASAPAAVEAGLLSSLARIAGWPAAEPQQILLTLRNATTKPAEFQPARALSFDSMSGGSATGVASRTPPKVEPGDCGATLSPGAACSPRLLVDGNAFFGEYSVRVGVAGVGGGWSERSQTIHVRASAILAFLVIVAGAACGSYVNSWRQNGRRAINGLIDVARLKRKIAEIPVDAGDAESRRIAAATLAEADDIETMLRRGDDAAAQIGRLNLRAGVLATLAEIGRGLRLLGAEGRAFLRPDWLGLVRRAETAASETETSGVREAAAAFAADVAAWPDIDAEVAGTERRAAALRTAEAAADGLGDPAAAAAVETSARQMLAIAHGPRRKDETVSSRLASLAAAAEAVDKEAGAYADAALAEIGRRAAALGNTATDPVDQATAGELATAIAAQAGRDAASRLAALPDLWRRHHALDAAVNGPGLVRTALPAAASPSTAAAAAAEPLPVELILPPPGAALPELQKSRARSEWRTAALVLLATGLGGVVTLWAPDPNWGTAIDMITAFLAGMAANVVIGSAIQKP